MISVDVLCIDIIIPTQIKYFRCVGYVKKQLFLQYTSID